MGCNIPIGQDDLFDTSIPISEMERYPAAKRNAIQIVQALKKARRKKIRAGKFATLIDQRFRDILEGILLDLATDGFLKYDTTGIIPRTIKLK